MILLFALVAWAQEDLSQQAARAMREQRFADAERMYRQLIEEVPGEPRLRMNLGLALHSGKKYKEAIGELRAYVKAAPAPGPAHFLIGLGYLKLSQPCQAIDPLLKAKQWQANEQVLVELGDAYSGCKRYVAAARSYEEAQKFSRNSAPLQRAAARAYWQGREYAMALKLFRGMEKSLASDAEFLYEYGDTLARSEGAEAGLPYLEKAVKAAPQMTPARGALGRALMELGRAKESVPHLEAAAATDDTLLLPLSRAYKATGRPEEAARVEAEYRKRVGRQN